MPNLRECIIEVITKTTGREQGLTGNVSIEYLVAKTVKRKTESSCSALRCGTLAMSLCKVLISDKYIKIAC